jgi:trimethylamine monooxygenase
MINIDSVDQFPGRILHSHEFRGVDVLIIGSSFSADDIALQFYKFLVHDQ